MKRFFRQCAALVKLSILELWRRNDLFALFVLALVLLIPLSMSKPFGAAGASRYMDEAALLLVWGYSLFLALGTGSRLFPPEFESRTIYPLLAKPISRGTLLFGKYLGALVATLSALALFYVLFAVASGLRGGAWFPSELLQAFVLHAMFVALAVALALFGSLLVTPSANLTLSAMALLAMFFFGRRLPEFAHHVSGGLAALANLAYAIGPHVEFFDMRQRVIHGWGGVDAATMAAVLLYGALYTAALLFLSALALRRKKL